MSQTFNYHTHTVRCGHALGLDEQYVKAAIMAGFTEIGFSEHMPYPEIDRPGERMLAKDIADYENSMQALKVKYQDQIKLSYGYEIEFFADQLEYLHMMRANCDYMILGQHVQFPNGYGYDYLCDDENVQTYTQQVIAAIKSGLISMVAHPDYFMLGRRDFNEVCVACVHELAKCAAHYHIPLEINLNGLRYGELYYADGRHVPYPYRPFWEIASQYDIDVVFGYDAHNPTTLLERKREEVALQILQGLPLHFLTSFTIK